MKNPELVYNPPVLTTVDKAYYGEAEPILRLQASVIRGDDSTLTSYGTAFVVKRNDDVYIISALHVVSGMNQFKFYTRDRKWVSVEVKNINRYDSLDAVVFHVKSISAKINPLLYTNFNTRTKCTTIGFPHNDKYTTGEGKIIGSYTSTSCYVESGMSGGPVISDGKVIGMISSKVLGSSDGTKSIIIRVEDILNEVQ
jgi:S1-C subfamily serine protease